VRRREMLKVKETIGEVPPLKGWLAVPQIVERLGVSRQLVQQWTAAGVFRTLRGVGERPLYVVRDKEVERLAYHHERSGSWAEAARLLEKDSDRQVGNLGV
jgi:predicted site-specific integrase-resolvase